MTVEVHERGTIIGAEVETPWINAQGEVSYDDLAPVVNYVHRQLASWVKTTRDAARPSVFNRAAYVAPDKPYALLALAKAAVENDDVIAGVCDVTEGLMLQGIKWESDVPDDADFFNQMSRDLNLDEFVRQWHREEFTYSQVVVGMWWGSREYSIRGETEKGNKRKRRVRAHVPVALTYLDPMRVVPLSPGPFGQDRLAWHASEEEYAAASASHDNLFQTDSVLAEFTMGKVTNLSRSERAYLQEIGVNPDRLLYLNPRAVFRSCRTKLSYERWPTLRLKSTFPLLDLKQQLMEADRVSLVGAANFILVVRQGTDAHPAQQSEIDNLKENFKIVAKLPIVIGDHRLHIDIVTPDQQHTLHAPKYDTLDRRILSRTLGALTISSTGQRNESTLTVARGIGRMLETRRHMMKRSLEYHIARAVVEHPLNEGVFNSEPNLVFSPRNVQLDQDSQIVQAIMALRTQKELSRESVLEFFGFDQAVEAMRRELEADRYDDIFQTQVPYSGTGNQGPNGTPEAPQNSGARGGRPVGGGESKKSPQRQVKPRTSNGNPST